MARPGKEQLFFYGSLGLTGLLGAWLFLDKWTAPKAPKGKAVTLDLAKVDVPRAPRGALKNSDWTRQGREAFREPRDWQPLPPAEVERPPLREPTYVPPPPQPAAGLERLGLYRQVNKITPHEFPGAPNADEAAAPADDTPLSAGDSTATPDDPTAGTPARSAGGSPARPANARPADSKSGGTLPPGAVQSLEEELRRKFDWLELVSDAKPWYGVILNKDKYGLDERPAELLQFQQMDPKTNHIKGVGRIERERIKSGGIHFADNAVNRTELLLRTMPERTWTASTLPKLLDLAEQLFALGKEDPYAYQRAAEHLEKCIKLDPKVARGWELLADARAALLDFDAELRSLIEAGKSGAESGGLIERRARWLLRTGAREAAYAKLKDGVVRHPADRGIHLALGRLLLDTGDTAGALEHFQTAVQQSATAEQRMQVTADVGAALLERGEAEKALQEAQRILNIDKGSALGLRLQGAAQFALGKSEAAADSYAKLSEAATTPEWEGSALLAQGLVRVRLKDFDAAKSDLEHVPQVNPLLAAQSSAALADLQARTGHLDEAIERCRDAVARAPDDPYLHYLLGLTLRRADDYEDARSELRRALDGGATFPDLFNELGFLALREGQAADARRYFEESLAREERDETKLYLAHAHLLAGDLIPASRLFETLNAKKPNSEAILGLAWCFYKRGESPSAQTLWQQVKEELPSAHPDDKAYAGRWLAMVQDLESKHVWEDNIPWREVGNGWSIENHFGLEQHATPGSFRLSGTQRTGTTVEQWTYLQRQVELPLFHEFEVDVAVAPGHQGRTGFGLAHFVGGAVGQAPQVRAALMLAIDADGTVLLQHREHTEDSDWKKIGQVDLKAGPVRLTMRRKEKGSSLFQFFADGSALGEPVEMSVWKGKSKQSLSALWFASAPGGKRCDAEMKRASRVEYLP